MKLNNFMFKEQFAYTYAEVLEKIYSVPYHSPVIRSKQEFAKFLPTNFVQTSDASIVNNFIKYSFISTGAFADAVPDRTMEIFNKISARYYEHYAVISDDELTASACQTFMKKLFNVLDYTFNKYDAILSAYESQKTHMLDKLSRIRSEEKEHSVEGEHSTTRGTEVDTTSSSASKTAGSDTPQTINVQASFDELKGYFNKYDQGEDEGTSHSEGTDTDSGTNSSSGTENLDATETYDPMTMMARIEEIQTQYENTMFKWVEEFDRLFIEEGNI